MQKQPVQFQLPWDLNIVGAFPPALVQIIIIYDFGPSQTPWPDLDAVQKPPPTPEMPPQPGGVVLYKEDHPEYHVENGVRKKYNISIIWNLVYSVCIPRHPGGLGKAQPVGRAHGPTDVVY